MCNEQGNGVVRAEGIETFTYAPPIQDKLEDDIEMYIEALHRCLVKYGYADLVGRFSDMVVLYVQIKAEKEGE